MTNEDKLPHKQLWISIWFNSLLTDRELNKSATFILLSYHIADMLTSHITSMLEQDFDLYDSEPIKIEPIYCAGSLVSFPSTSHSVLCYCGRRFTRRFDSRQETWTIPKHQPKEQR